MNPREDAWRRLFDPGALDALPPSGREDARRAAEIILAAHRRYLGEFNALTAKAQDTFERRAWVEASADAERRVRLYRPAVYGTWGALQKDFASQLASTAFWMGARHCYLNQVFDDYDSDLALTFFYSVMRMAFDHIDVPVEYADDGLAEHPHVWNSEPVYNSYSTNPADLARAIEAVLDSYGFHVAFENATRDAALAAERILAEWERNGGCGQPAGLSMLRPALYRDREAYLAGKLCSSDCEMPVVFALAHGDSGITVDAVLVGKEAMRNILFVSTRSTFHVRADSYREVLEFLDSMAPERGHPAMCAVIGFTHPARVALNQRLRYHLANSGETFVRTPGRAGMAMIVFSPPSFPYVFKVIRDYSQKPGWKGSRQIAELYRWVHEMNRGRLMLDAWIYRNLRFPREAFEESVLHELLESASSSVRLQGETVVLKHMYAQRRVQPLSTFFDQTRDRTLREKAVDALGTFIEDMAGMGLFIGDCYGLPFNTGLTHGFNVALFDFDDLGPLANCRFRETPPPRDEDEELLWNTEADGAWFSTDLNDVLVDEWQRYLGVPKDLDEYFRQKHGRLFTAGYWLEEQRRVEAGRLHFVLPYPRERKLLETRRQSGLQTDCAETAS